jgi:hypothetical protein
MRSKSWLSLEYQKRAFIVRPAPKIEAPLPSGIGRQNKDSILPANFGVRIAHKINTVDIAREAGKQLQRLPTDDPADQDW